MGDKLCKSLSLRIWGSIHHITVCSILLLFDDIIQKLQCFFSPLMHSLTDTKYWETGAGEIDSSAVKSTGCSSRFPVFNSQQTHSGRQPSVMWSDALFWCVWRYQQCTHIHNVCACLKILRNFIFHKWNCT